MLHDGLVGCALLLDLIRQAVCIASRFDMQGLPFIADQGSRLRSSGKTMNGA